MEPGTTQKTRKHNNNNTPRRFKHTRKQAEQLNIKRRQHNAQTHKHIKRQRATTQTHTQSATYKHNKNDTQKGKHITHQTTIIQDHKHTKRQSKTRETNTTQHITNKNKTHQAKDNNTNTHTQQQQTHIKNIRNVHNTKIEDNTKTKKLKRKKQQHKHTHKRAEQ